MRGAGRVVFAAILLLIVGTLNIIYGIGALDDANFFVNDTRFILDNLNTLGWVLIILGVIQLAGGFSLMAGNPFGRVIGIFGGSLGAIGALLSIGEGNPGGRWASSSSASTSSTESSCSARTSEPPESESSLPAGARRRGGLPRPRALSGQAPGSSGR